MNALATAIATTALGTSSAFAGDYCSNWYEIGGKSGWSLSEIEGDVQYMLDDPEYCTGDIDVTIEILPDAAWWNLGRLQLDLPETGGHRQLLINFYNPEGIECYATSLSADITSSGDCRDVSWDVNFNIDRISFNEVSATDWNCGWRVGGRIAFSDCQVPRYLDAWSCNLDFYSTYTSGWSNTWLYCNDLRSEGCSWSGGSIECSRLDARWSYFDNMSNAVAAYNGASLYACDFYGMQQGALNVWCICAESCRFENCSNDGPGGAIRTDYAYQLSNCEFINVESGTYGDAIAIDNFNLTQDVAGCSSYGCYSNRIPRLAGCTFDSCGPISPNRTYADDGNNSIEAVCPGCEADLDCRFGVGPGDIALLLSLWDTSSELADLDGDGRVHSSDLARILVDWGTCQ